MITNTLNGKRYIGKTSKPIEDRFDQHLYNSRRGADTYFYNAIRKYGQSKFVISLVETTALEQLPAREIFYIAELKPEYNTTKGGEGAAFIKKSHFITDGIIQRRVPIEIPIPAGFVKGVKPSTQEKLKANRAGKINSDQTREKLRAAGVGKKHSEETKSKMKVSRSKQKISDDTKAKMSKAHIGQKASEDTRAKISVALSGRSRKLETKAKLSFSWALKRAIQDQSPFSKI